MATATSTNSIPTTEIPRHQETQFVGIYFDADRAKQQIAKHWKWIMAGGVASVVAGVLALLAPVLATAAVATFIPVLLLVVGCVNLMAPMFAPDGMKLDSFLIGVVQVLLAAVMAFYPFASVLSMTILIASVFMVEGIVRIGLAIAAREVPGWGWTLASGICTVALSGLIIAGLPGAALWVIGILVGVNMITNGGARIGLAVEGRKLAKAETQYPVARLTKGVVSAVAKAAAFPCAGI